MSCGSGPGTHPFRRFAAPSPSLGREGARVRLSLPLPSKGGGWGVGESSVPLPFRHSARSIRYCLKHAVNVRRDVMVREAQHRIAQLPQTDIAVPIRVRIMRVRSGCSRNRRCTVRSCAGIETSGPPIGRLASTARASLPWAWVRGAALLRVLASTICFANMPLTHPPTPSLGREGEFLVTTAPPSPRHSPCSCRAWSRGAPSARPSRGPCPSCRWRPARP